MALRSLSPRSGCKHKAWGGAKRNPRMMTGKKTERAKRVIAQTLQFTHDKALSPTSRALPSYFNYLSWGFASLHPRLYAIAALRGLKKNSSPTCAKVPEVFTTKAKHPAQEPGASESQLADDLLSFARVVFFRLHQHIQRLVNL